MDLFCQGLLDWLVEAYTPAHVSWSLARNLQDMEAINYLSYVLSIS